MVEMIIGVNGRTQQRSDELRVSVSDHSFQDNTRFSYYVYMRDSGDLAVGYDLR